MIFMKNISIVFILFVLIGMLSGCGVNHKIVNYPMGDGKYSISARGNSAINQDDIKEFWYIEASKLCPNGFNVDGIEEKRKHLDGYPKPGLEGIITCK